MCLAQAGIAQSVEHFTRNEGVVSSSLISSLYMTDGSPVSLEYEDAGLFLCVWMWLREAGEGGIGPGVDGVVDAVEVLWGGCGRGTPEEGGIGPGRDSVGGYY